jgi:hypothetical protein
MPSFAGVCASRKAFTVVSAGIRKAISGAISVVLILRRGKLVGKARGEIGDYPLFDYTFVNTSCLSEPGKEIFILGGKTERSEVGKDTHSNSTPSRLRALAPPFVPLRASLAE